MLDVGCGLTMSLVTAALMFSPSRGHAQGLNSHYLGTPAPQLHLQYSARPPAQCDYWPTQFGRAGDVAMPRVVGHGDVKPVAAHQSSGCEPDCVLVDQLGYDRQD